MDARLFQEAIRTATVTYPIPFVFSILLLFAVLCFGGSLLAQPGLMILLASIGSLSTVSAIALVAYAALAKPELLRSERHVLSMRMAHILGDKDMDPTTRDRISHAVIDPGDRVTPKSGDRRKRNQPNRNEGEKDG